MICLDVTTVTIRNRSRRPFLATLYHDVYCRYSNRCGCKKEEYSNSTSEGLRREYRKKHASLFILGGEEAPGLHPAVQKLEQVRNAVKYGGLTVALVGASEPKAASPPQPSVIEATEVSRASSRRSRGSRSPTESE